MNTTITWQEYTNNEFKYDNMVIDDNYVITVTDTNNDIGTGFTMKKAPDSMPTATIVYEGCD